VNKQFASQIQDKESVNSIFLLREKTVQTGKNGKPYMTLVLADKTGTIDGRIWDQVESRDQDLESGDFVLVKGTTQTFQGRRQLIVNTIEGVDGFEIDLKDFLPTSKVAAEKMFSDLMKILEKIQNPFIKQLVVQTLESAEIKPLFLTCPAAKTIHHAYLGGLLEHVLSIAGIMVFLAEHYPELDLDLLLFGAVFHDIGKIWELNFETTIGYTDIGRLVGHIPLGSELVEKRTAEIPNFPYELKNICKHIVLSHHGKVEYGSPKVPQILEAFVVAAIDDFDSKMNSISMIIDAEKGKGEKWSRYNNLFERYFFLGQKNR
jgi:3'-5' exoribonuclease